MKHRILIEFESDKLPDDFTDQVAGRVYMIPCVKKTECTATLFTNKEIEVIGWDNCRGERQCGIWCGSSTCVSHTQG